MARSMDKMAEALEIISQHRREAASRPATSASVPAAPGPQFTIEAAGGAAYRLRNVSTVLASGISFEVPTDHKVTGYEGVITGELAAFQSLDFMMSNDAVDEVRPIGELAIECDQLEEPVYVPVP